MPSIRPEKMLLSPGQLDRAAHLFGVLSETSRLQILQELMPGACTVGELVDKTGMKQGNVSKQLGILYQARLVDRTREGNFVHYAIREPVVFELCKIVCQSLHKQALAEVKDLTPPSTLST